MKPFRNFFEDTRSIQADIGGEQNLPYHYGHSIWKRWVQFEFKIKEYQNIGFCPDKEFKEFNPAGCKNPREADSCMRTALSTYTPDMNLCRKPMSRGPNDPDPNSRMKNLLAANQSFFDHNNFNNITFYTYVNDYFNVLATMDKGIKNLQKTQKIDMKEVKNIKLLIKNANTPYFKATEIACDMLTNIDPMHQNKKCNIDTTSALFRNHYSSGDNFIKLIIEAVENSRPEVEGINNGSPNGYLRKKLEEQVKLFLQNAKMVIVKTNALLSGCPCFPVKNKCNAINKEFRGKDVKKTTYYGNTEEEKDLDCCRKCAKNPKCQFWVRNRYGNELWLKRKFKGYSNSSNRRGAMKDDSSNKLPLKCAPC